MIYFSAHRKVAFIMQYRAVANNVSECRFLSPLTPKVLKRVFHEQTSFRVDEMTLGMTVLLKGSSNDIVVGKVIESTGKKPTKFVVHSEALHLPSCVNSDSSKLSYGVPYPQPSYWATVSTFYDFIPVSTLEEVST